MSDGELEPLFHLQLRIASCVGIVRKLLPRGLAQVEQLRVSMQLLHATPAISTGRRPAALSIDKHTACLPTWRAGQAQVSAEPTLARQLSRNDPRVHLRVRGADWPTLEPATGGAGASPRARSRRT